MLQFHCSGSVSSAVNSHHRWRLLRTRAGNYSFLSCCCFQRPYLLPIQTCHNLFVGERKRPVSCCLVEQKGPSHRDRTASTQAHTGVFHPPSRWHRAHHPVRTERSAPVRSVLYLILFGGQESKRSDRSSTSFSFPGNTFPT